MYNVPVTNDVNVNRIMDAVENIYTRQTHSFRINLSFGVILRNIETDEYRYFRPYSNTEVLAQPFHIVRHSDLLKLRKQLDTMSLTDHILTQRPDTKWKPVLVTNVVF